MGSIGSRVLSSASKFFQHWRLLLARFERLAWGFLVRLRGLETSGLWASVRLQLGSKTWRQGLQRGLLQGTSDLFSRVLDHFVAVLRV